MLFRSRRFLSIHSSSPRNRLSTTSIGCVALSPSDIPPSPIYSHRLDGLNNRRDHLEYAEILDTSLRDNPPRPRALCRGRRRLGPDAWLWSTPVHVSGIEAKWGRMSDTSVAWMARPVSHENTLVGRLVSRLDKPSRDRLQRWTRECLVLPLGGLLFDPTAPANPPNANPWGAT